MAVLSLPKTYERGERGTGTAACASCQFFSEPKACAQTLGGSSYRCIFRSFSELPVTDRRKKAIDSTKKAMPQREWAEDCRVMSDTAAKLSIAFFPASRE